MMFNESNFENKLFCFTKIATFKSNTKSTEWNIVNTILKIQTVNDVK